MLSKSQRRSVARALARAYYTYRDLSFRELCKRERIFLTRRFDVPDGGRYRHWGEYNGELEDGFLVQRYRKAKAWRWAKREERRMRFRMRFLHAIEIPAPVDNKRPHPLTKEKTFWHEMGHLVISGHFPGYVGYADYLYSFTPDYWEHERLVEAFAGAMMLYRHGLEPKLEPDPIPFFFADQQSLCYEQMYRFGAARIANYCREAQTQRRNVDLTALQALVEKLELHGSYGGVQPDLPMGYEDTHREMNKVRMRYHYVDSVADRQHEDEQGAGKESWREPYPDEVRLCKQMHILRDRIDHEQLALFPERAAVDKAHFDELFQKFERAVKKYQTPA